ncbi:hypothetical protein SAICODRAFT_73978 [Saitoella complicata NRRL Y-17804]|uniref:Uncharacterized protein n=1 Tax=Saitoella complicata (strain BCRC 22490 / CBS 7301 / JCM 7358 / NBRC 10748 / NRRL Y-17804) TaxID=698492 RepID=A0A0E9NR02_SAICN|nr:uncharacterized protein SAICODRAFT_73978 [Saitoella complicata NRRL Y-17804]ODQ49671.1 hypothetical protein SAICODRAFT_73978 [Saitoella complicata NRRL Y-17804]GAO51850.1 hypothetical protein G7K_5941-t1 [Saitoella complicata NRRL Y-17804]
MLATPPTSVASGTGTPSKPLHYSPGQGFVAQLASPPATPPPQAVSPAKTEKSAANNVVRWKGKAVVIRVPAWDVREACASNSIRPTPEGPESSSKPIFNHSSPSKKQKPTVHIPDPTEWNTHIHALREAKLAALGVGPSDPRPSHAASSSLAHLPILSPGPLSPNFNFIGRQHYAPTTTNFAQLGAQAGFAHARLPSISSSLASPVMGLGLGFDGVPVSSLRSPAGSSHHRLPSFVSALDSVVESHTEEPGLEHEHEHSSERKSSVTKQHGHSHARANSTLDPSAPAFAFAFPPAIPASPLAEYASPMDEFIPEIGDEVFVKPEKEKKVIPIVKPVSPVRKTPGFKFPASPSPAAVAAAVTEEKEVDGEDQGSDADDEDDMLAGLQAAKKRIQVLEAANVGLKKLAGKGPQLENELNITKSELASAQEALVDFEVLRAEKEEVEKEYDTLQTRYEGLEEDMRSVAQDIVKEQISWRREFDEVSASRDRYAEQYKDSERRRMELEGIVETMRMDERVQQRKIWELEEKVKTGASVGSRPGTGGSMGPEAKVRELEGMNATYLGRIGMLEESLTMLGQTAKAREELLGSVQAMSESRRLEIDRLSSELSVATTSLRSVEEKVNELRTQVLDLREQGMEKDVKIAKLELAVERQG